jgi:hypothetical protein
VTKHRFFNVKSDSAHSYHSLLTKSFNIKAMDVESESEGILGGVGVGKNVPTPIPTSI